MQHRLRMATGIRPDPPAYSTTGISGWEPESGVILVDKGSYVVVCT